MRFINAILETGHRLYKGDILVPLNSVMSFKRGNPAQIIVTNINPGKGALTLSKPQDKNERRRRTGKNQ